MGAGHARGRGRIRPVAVHRFRAELWEHSPSEPGSWHFMAVPAGLAERLREEAGPRRGFGSIPVRARIGDTGWRTSLFPDARRGTLLLPVKKQVRVAERLDPGGTYQVTLEAG